MPHCICALFNQGLTDAFWAVVGVNGVMVHIDSVTVHMNGVMVHIDDITVHMNGVMVHIDDVTVHMNDTTVHADAIEIINFLIIKTS